MEQKEKEELPGDWEVKGESACHGVDDDSGDSRRYPYSSCLGAREEPTRVGTGGRIRQKIN